MEKAQNSLDLWMLFTSVAAMCYILIATFLLYVLHFDLEISQNEKAGIGMIFFALSGVVAYSYRQALKKFRVYKHIFGEEPDIGKFTNSEILSETDKFQSWQKLLGKSHVRRFSFPITYREKLSYHYNKAAIIQDNFAPKGQRLSEADTITASVKNSNCASFNDYGEIPVILHDCVKDLGDVIQRIKSLNNAYTQTFEDITVTKQNSTTISEAMNSDSKVIRVEALQFQTKNNEISENIPNTSEDIRCLHQEPYENSVQEKLIKTNKAVSSNPISQNLWVSELLREPYTQQVSEDATNCFPKSFIVDSEQTEHFLMKIPSYTRKSCSVGNLKPEPREGEQKISICFYKRKPPLRQGKVFKSLARKHLRKITMKPYILKIPITQCIQEKSKKRYGSIITRNDHEVPQNMTVSRTAAPIVSSNETKNCENLSTISKKKPIVSVNELLLSMKESLITELNESKFCE